MTVDSDGKISDIHGALEIVDSKGVVAASWSFRKFLEHWSKKHARAVYVPSQSNDSGGRKYRFGSRVRLAVGTNPLLLLRAIGEGEVFYDPGIKLENASSEKPLLKRRSQFRAQVGGIDRLYSVVEIVDVCSAAS